LQPKKLDLQYDGVVVHGENKANLSLLIQTKCPCGVVYEDIEKVIGLLELKRELHLCYKSKIKGLKLD
jgi:hypothetical protein